MTVNDDAIVWAFDGHDGRDEGLAALLGFYQSHLAQLLPEDSDDPFERIVAGMSDDPTETMRSHPRLARLFPPALADERASGEFWRNTVSDQARARLTAAEAVQADLASWEGYIPVRLAAIGDWAKTLGGLRLFWYAELAGTDRLAQPSEEAIEANPALVDLVEWLGFLLEDLMESRDVCAEEGHSLDPGQFRVRGHGGRD